MPTPMPMPTPKRIEKKNYLKKRKKIEIFFQKKIIKDFFSVADADADTDTDAD